MEAVMQNTGLNVVPPAADQDRELIDQVIYLGSLASRREDVDPMLDVLREVTARHKAGDALASQERVSLQALRVELKNYILNRDPLRAFTPETLERRLKGQLDEQALSTGNNLSQLIAVLMASVGAAVLALFVPPYSLSLGFRVMLSVPLFFVALHVGIAWFYITALKNFNRDVRRVFIYVSLGIVILSVGFSHYVALNLFGLDSYDFLRYGGVTWSFSIPFMLMFIGLSIYAKLLGVKSKLLSPWLVLGVAFASTVLVVVAPHAKAEDEFYFDFWTTGAAMIPVFALMGSILAKKIKQSVTPAYARPMGWLYLYMLVVGLGAILATGVLFAFGELHGAALSIVTASCGIVPQLLLLYTGYSFKKETS